VNSEKNKNPWLKFFLFIAGVFIFFALINFFTGEYTECITDSWCISSKDDLLLMSAFQTLFIVIVAFAIRYAFIFAVWMITSKHANIWTAIFFFMLGILGIAAYLLTVPADDKIEFVHIPIIAGVIILIGFAFLFFFKKKKKKSSHPHSEI
jgi:LPXTG-motif cell wall-anchored protein